MKRRAQLLGILLVCILGSFAILLRMLTCIITNPDKAFHIAVALDRAVNVAANGDGRETISSRAHRAMLEGKVWGCILCKTLDKLHKNHCQKSKGI